MNLKKFFEEKGLTKEDIIAVGAKDGTSYLYIGPADYSEIKNRYMEHKTKTERTLAEAFTKLFNLCAAQPEFTGNGAEEDFGIVTDYAARVAKLWNTCVSYNKFLHNYIELEDREVAESFWREDENDLAILVEGTETGSFWFKSEYDKTYKK